MQPQRRAHSQPRHPAAPNQDSHHHGYPAAVETPVRQPRVIGWPSEDAGETKPRANPPQELHCDLEKFGKM